MRFLKSQDGGASAEAVLWFPIYVLVIGLVFDTTMLLIGKTEMWSVANDASRMVALGRMDETTAKAWVETTASDGREFSATVSKSGDIVTTTIERPFRSVPSLGIVTSLSSDLVTESHYRIEPTT